MNLREKSRATRETLRSFSDSALHGTIRPGFDRIRPLVDEAVPAPPPEAQLSRNGLGRRGRRGGLGRKRRMRLRDGRRRSRLRRYRADCQRRT